MYNRALRLRHFVPSRDPAQRFDDILANIERIEIHIAGIENAAAFEQNVTAYDAVERCLQRISEAASKLGVEADGLCPEIAWFRIRGLGNILRHEYDRVEGARIWYTIKDDLPALKAACESTLRALRKGRA